MNEFKRVLLNKRIIIAFLLLIVISTGFYLNTQYQAAKNNGAGFFETNSYRKEIFNDLHGKSVQRMQEDINAQLNYVSVICSLMDYDVIKAEDYQNYSEHWQEQETELRKINPDIAKEYDKNKNSLDREEYRSREWVLSEILSQIQYIEEYPEYLKSIDAKAEQMNSISIFAEDNSLSNANINRTVEDYAPLKKIELSIGNDKPITTVLEFDSVHYLIFIFGILVVFSFIEERRRGLWNVVYSTPNGRFTLALRRAGIICVSITFAVMIMYFVLFAVSFILYGGWEDIFRTIQSIELFQNFIFPMSEIQFILLYIFVNIITQLVLAFLFWFIMSFIQNTSIALGLAGVIFAIEFALYSILPIQSNLAILKCMNIFYYINPTEAIIKYCNLNVFFFLVNLYRLVLISALLFMLLFALLSLITTANKYPGKTPNKLEVFLMKIISGVANFYWKLVEKLTITGTELYKILIIQKGWVVLLAIALILFNSIDTGKLYYSGTDSIVNSFYDEYSGPLTERTRQYVNNLENEIANVDSEFQKANEDYAVNKISYDEYMNHVFKSEAYDSKREALKIIQERIEYIDQNKTNGTDAWLVNPNGYDALLNISGFSRQKNFALILVFCLIIIMSGIFSFEKRSMMYGSIMASSEGRQYLFGKKMICAIIITLFVWLCAGVTEIIDICIRYPLTTFDAPLKSFEFLNGLPFNFSIGAFLVLLYLSRLMLLLSVSCIVCFISLKTKYESSIIISSAILIAPSLLYAVGIDAFAYISVTVPISAMNLIIYSNGYTFIIPILLIIFIGILAVFLTKRKWCNESRCKNGA